ncbi:MAG: DNA-binding domain-containing protein [Candidatus Obscuribacterales bacterium]|nr:DNA-binding domain-containing protein [Candidatus Obscuribacterales bacterium]
MSALTNLEKTLSVLWTNESARSKYLKDGRLPDGEFSKSITEAIDERGVRTYAELIAIGRNDLMLSVYPGCARLLNKKWKETLDDYFETCPPKHYRLNMSAANFSQYLKDNRADLLQAFPYLSDLADYEWIELQLMEDKRQASPEPYEPLSRPEQFEKSAPIVNPVLSLRNYNYQVPVIVEYLRDGEMPRNITPREIMVAVYRDPETHMGRYVEVTPGIACVIEQAQSAPTSYADLATLAISYSKASNPQDALLEFFEVIEKLQSLKLFIGTQAL